MNQLSNIDNNQSAPSFHAAYVYDNVGNQLHVNSERFYEWDVADQLKYFKIDASGSDPSIQAQYHYAGGERVKKETKNQQGETEVTVYIDGLVEHRYKKNSSGVITDEQNIIHIMDGRSRIATVRSGDDFGDTTPAIKYNLEDHLGTSTVRLDENGDLIDREEYYPFGDSSLRTFDKKRYRYVGKELDAESGLYYYGARYYSAWTCRFISIDPLADKYPDLNPYNYSANDPIGDFDVDGMQSNDKSQGEFAGKGDNLGPITKGKNKSKSSKEAKTESNNIDGGITLDGVEISEEQQKFNEEADAIMEEYAGQNVEINVHSEDDGNGNFKGIITVKGDDVDFTSTTEYSNDSKEDQNAENPFEGVNRNPEDLIIRQDPDLEKAKQVTTAVKASVATITETLKQGKSDTSSGKLVGKWAKALTRVGTIISVVSIALILTDVYTSYKNGTLDWKEVTIAAVGVGLIVAGIIFGGPFVIASILFSILVYSGAIEKLLNGLENLALGLIELVGDTFDFMKELIETTKQGISDIIYGIKRGWPSFKPS